MRLNDDINRGPFVFLTDADAVGEEVIGSYANHYKRMLVVMMDGEIVACLPQPIAAQRMLSASNVFYYQTQKLTPYLRDEIQHWFQRQLEIIMDRMSRAHQKSDPFHGLSKRVQ